MSFTNMKYHEHANQYLLLMADSRASASNDEKMKRTCYVTGQNGCSEDMNVLGGFHPMTTGGCLHLLVQKRVLSRITEPILKKLSVQALNDDKEDLPNHPLLPPILLIVRVFFQ